MKDELNQAKRGWRWLMETRLRRFVTFVVLALTALQTVYVLAANVVLGTGLLKRWVSGKDLLLAYDSAYSLWPGHAHVNGFLLRTADENVQLELTIDEATVDVNLSRLLHKQFYAERTRAQGTRFKLRHKVHDPDTQRLRLAEYPPVEGYEGQLVYETPPKSSPEQSSDSWTIRMEDVEAQVRELWILEYRYQGNAVATGAFELEPGKSFELSPSRLHVESGGVTVGDRVVANDFAGELKSRIDRMNLQRINGTQVFRHISGRFTGTLQGGDLEFLNVYLKPTISTEVRGPFSAELQVETRNGVLMDSTKVRFQTEELRLDGTHGTLHGALQGRLVVPSDEPNRLELRATATKVAGVGKSAPTASQLEGVLQVGPVALDRSMTVKGYAVRVEELAVPSFSWFQRFVTRRDRALAGSGSLNLHWDALAEQTPSGRMQLALVDFSWEQADFRLRCDAKLQSRFRRTNEAFLAVDDFQLSLHDSQLRLASSATKTWDAQLASSSMRWLDQTPMAAQGTFDITVNRTKAVLPLVLSWFPREVASQLLGLDELRARVAIYASSNRQRVEVLRAESGSVNLRGAWENHDQRRRGAFLLGGELFEVGVELDQGSVDVSLGAGTRFLSSTLGGVGEVR